MEASSPVIVYIACSLDGFISGPENDVSWLPQVEIDTSNGGLNFTDFCKGVGALLMGRQTFDTVNGFDLPWPYGETPVYVATHNELDTTIPTVTRVEGDIETIIEQVRSKVDSKIIYVDGGDIIRQALGSNLIDEIIVTLIPIVLGKGQSLFAGMEDRKNLVLLSQSNVGNGMVQLHYRVVN